MQISRQERIARENQLKKIHSYKIVNRNLKKSIALISTATVLSTVVNLPQFTIQAQAVSKSVSTQQSFLNKITPYASEIARVNDIYASVMIAQAALESGWGQSSLSKAPTHNLFGIKGSYNGNTSVVNTLEDDGSGNYYTIQAGFRAYPSYKESLNDYADKMVNGLTYNKDFYAGTWKSNTTSYKDATAYLTGRYATDTRYATKLNSIISSFNLVKYDTPANSNKTVTTAQKQVAPVEASSATGTYTVNKGDGLWRIASTHGMTVAELKALNGLTSELIHPGQVLRTTKSVQATVATTTETKKTDEKVTTTKEQTKTTASNKHETTVASNTSTGSYTVQKGDGLWRIASKHGMTVAELKTANGLTSDLIHPGQKLKTTKTVQTATKEVTSTSTTKATAAATTAKKETVKTTTQSYGSYTVQKGDGLWKIASKHGMTVAQLKAANGLKSDLIHPGQVLKTNNAIATSTSTTSTKVVSKSENKEVKASTTATAPKAQVTATSTGSYTVQKGDGLWRIANDNGLTLAQIKAINGLTDNTIHPGQVLKVTGSAQTTAKVQTVNTPVAKETPVTEVKAVVESKQEVVQVTEATPTTPVVEAPSTAQQSYTVQAKDNMYRIAVNHGVTLSALMAANDKSSADIHPGDVLVIPNK